MAYQTPEEIKERRHLYYIAHKEEFNAKSAAYKNTHKEQKKVK